MVMELPVPVLADPLKASDVEPGNTTHTRSGEARESTESLESLTSDSRGGQVYLPDVHVLTIDDLTRAHVVLTWIGAVRGRRADYLPLNKWDDTP